MLRRLRRSLLMPVVALAVLVASVAAVAEIAADRAHAHAAAAGEGSGLPGHDDGGQATGCAHCLHVSAASAVAQFGPDPAVGPFPDFAPPYRRTGGCPSGATDPPQRPPKA